MGQRLWGWPRPVRVGLGGRAPSLGFLPCPGPGLTCVPPALQKVRSYGTGLLSADEFQNLFNELDRRVTKEVVGAGRGPPLGPGSPRVIGKFAAPVGQSPGWLSGRCQYCPARGLWLLGW